MLPSKKILKIAWEMAKDDPAIPKQMPDWDNTTDIEILTMFSNLSAVVLMAILKYLDEHEADH